MKIKRVVFLLILLFALVGGVSALTWTSANGCWTATDGSDSLVMWNATVTNSYVIPAGVTAVQYLVVAGGGSGGARGIGAGAGAGGMLNNTGYSVTPGETVPVVVGAGGASVAFVPGGTNGNSGGHSIFKAIDATGGGYGAAKTGDDGGNGGSGGGSASDGGAGGTGIAGPPIQGKDGAKGTGNPGGGGGGKGGAGNGGDTGGIGQVNSITGTAITYATGGDGMYITPDNGAAGTNGLGNGGGGGNLNSGKGGDGVIIIRFPTVSSSKPAANFTATPVSLMYGSAVQFNDTSSNTPTMWNYSFLLGGVTTWNNGTTLAAQNLTRVFSTGGNYTVQLWAQNGAGGNYSLFNQTIDVWNWSPTSMSGTPKSGPNPLLVTFTGSSNNATQYYWEFGDGATDATQSPTHNYVTNGVYNVNYGTTNSQHSYNWSNNTGYITVNVTLNADFSGTPTSGILNPDLPVSFTDMSTGAGLYSWTWDFGDTGSSSLRNPSHSYTTPGSYNVKLTISGSDGSTSKTKNGYITAISNSTVGGALNFTPVIAYQGGGTIVYQNKTFNFYDQNFTPWPIYLFIAAIGLFFLTVSFIVRRNAEIFAALAIIPLAFTAWGSLAIDMSQSFGMSGMLYNQTSSGNMWMLLENHTVYPSVVLAVIFLILSVVAFVQFVHELLQGRTIEDTPEGSGGDE